MGHYDSARAMSKEIQKDKNKERWKKYIRERIDDLSYDELQFLYRIMYKNEHGMDNLQDVMDYFRLQTRVENIVKGNKT